MTNLQSDAANAEVMDVQRVEHLLQLASQHPSDRATAIHKLCLSHERLRLERDELKRLMAILVSGVDWEHEKFEDTFVEECRKWR